MGNEKKMVRLKCEAGDHYWMRESQRGRKPFNCPDHDPRVVLRSTVGDSADTNLQVLWCEHGQHEWNRPRTGGDKPLYCPRHLEPVDFEAERVKAEEANRKRQEGQKKSREQKQQKRKERTREEKIQRLAELRERLPKIEASYDAAMDKWERARTPKEIEKGADAADRMQNAFINVSASIRALEGELKMDDQVTA